MKQDFRVSAVVTHYNSGGTILNVLRALRKQSHPLGATIVVDNASNDGSLEQLLSDFPDVHAVRLAENLGLSRARNIGLRTAASELVLFVDDDVYLAETALESMLEVFSGNHADVVCPRIVFHPEQDTIQSDGAAIHFAGMLSVLNANCSIAATPPMPGPVDAFTGACLLMDRRTLLELGGFDEDYFFYFEDMELSYRLRALGYSLWRDPRAIGLHDRGMGTPGLSFRGTGAYPLRRVYYVLRHRWLTILLHYHWRTLLILAPALAIYESAAFAECVRRGWAGVWFKALWSLLKDFPSVRSRRGRWQSSRRLRDGSLLSGGDLPFAPGFVEKGRTATLVKLLNLVLNSYWGWAKPWL